MTKVEQTAYHEAGHAVASYAFKRGFTEVTIISEGDNLGSKTVPNSNFHDIFERDYKTRNIYERLPKTRNHIEEDIIILLAGDAAEWVFSGLDNWDIAWEVNSAAVSLADLVVTDSDDIDAYLNRLFIRTRNLIDTWLLWRAVEALADELLKRKTIGYRRAIRIIADTLSPHSL